MKFIGHPGVEAYFAHWFRKSFPRAKEVFWHDLNVMGEMGSLKGVIEMIEHEVGVSIVAEHCVSDRLKAKSFARITSEGGSEALNQIYVATLESNPLPYRVRLVVDEFYKMVG